MIDEALQGTESAERPRRRRRLRAAILAGLMTTGLVAALVLGNGASGQTADPPGPSARREKAPKARPGMRGFKHGMGKHGIGMGRPIHGEFVVPKREGGFQTLAMHRGEATAVSDSSITVRSADGFSRTYAVNGDTRVNRDGKIGDIKQGAKVGVMAVVEGNNARAVRIVDEAFKKQMRDQMRERRRSMRPGSF